MKLELKYQEMAYIRELLHKDYNHRNTINQEIRENLLRKLQKLEDDYAAGLVS